MAFSLPHKVLPRATDSRITIFTSQDNYCYVPTVPLNKLLIVLPGTGASPQGIRDFMFEGQKQGFHVIGLYYPNGGTTAHFTSGKQWIEEYAKGIIFGTTNLVTGTVINYPDCIESRIVKALQWLNRSFPTEGWGQYYTADNFDYTKATIAGHSLGGNFAACIGKFKQCERIICVSSPRVVPGTDWGVFATLLSNFYFLWHDLDKADGGIDQDAILRQMGVLEIPKIMEQGIWGKVMKSTLPCPVKRAHKIVWNDSVTPSTGGIFYYAVAWINLMIGRF